MEIVELSLDALQPHPANSNVMSKEMVMKLAGHIERTGQYPPVIVRRFSPVLERTGEAEQTPHCEQKYQLLDGHHRVQALRLAGMTTARCVVWQADDEQALMLLATLNRLQGQDDPHKRAVLLRDLAERRGVEMAALSRELPERRDQIAALASLNDKVRQVLPRTMQDQLVPVHFFLMPADRQRLEERLQAIGGRREAALLSLI